MTEIHDVDVLIAGAGPTGSTLAADLLRRGLTVRLVDKAQHAFKGSRAKGLQPRTQEVFHDLGVVDEALAEGGPYPVAGFHLGPITLPWRMMQNIKATSSVPYPNILLLPQNRTDAILHRLIDRFGLSIYFDTSVDNFEQDSNGVTSTLSSGEVVRSKYLVGADGGSSTVRKASGIPFVGETFDTDRSLIIDATIDGLSRDRWHIWARTHGKTVAACPLPHSDQFQIMIRLTPNEKPDLNEDALILLFDKLTGLRLHNITWTSVFRPNIRLAKKYRLDRVFLAGDAAHVHPPSGGQGLNTGVQDAYNLGWKIGQVLAGAPDSLLDSYEEERLPIAARVLGKSSELYAGIDKLRLSALKRGDEERQLGITYYAGPLAPSDAAATKTLKVGDRAPDAPCTGADGVQRLFDIYKGPHFTLLAFGTNATHALQELKWSPGGAELKRYSVGHGSGDDDMRLHDASGEMQSIYGITGDTLILIRPDGYIGSIITNDWKESFYRVAKRFAPLQ
ncbi:FAD-dependent monooxygenase [Paenibacillus macquariensis]|uniref:2-polyprenyl-6-methoxyphenol hydroxylase n=1 Tax=Paenibacillus macquariensis TaxID=948756 RepID=A0ABY1JUX5_9BACL|nr:FAD-dependent monooxygenase [Paenibacillus macquariensis]MEC0090864.1 FAD-dependent monooxygenase [Paenibacillus macquariensis]OAB34597.1 FAD-binding monooxygenase [Paenibacillus macquariensis subsp. macquariensis]SIQ81892.1 2-polyprenyl-6-methoxyphenol hydroxylase [Paenibacillus macquariensis]